MRTGLIYNQCPARLINCISSLTPRMIRREVEKIMELEEGALDVKLYRDAVKKATADAMAVSQTSNLTLDLT